MARGIKIPKVVDGFGRIERRKGTDNWYMVYRPVPGARPIVRATKTADQQTAYDMLVDLAGKYKRGELAGDASATNCTFDHLFALLEADYRKHNRASTEDMLKRVDKHLRPWFGKTRVIELRKRSVEKFIASRLDGFPGKDGETETLDPASVNKMLAYMRRAMRLGAEEDPPLVLRVPRWFAKVPGESVRSGLVLPDTYQAIKAAMETAPHVRLAFVIAYHTGMRRGAILQLRWEWIDWRDGVIVIPPDPGASTKRKPREVPIYGEMRAYLEMARASARTPYVVEFDGKRVESIKTAWNAACRRAGLSSPPLFHDLRRTAITRMEAAGIPRHIAMEASGHRTQHVYERYNIASRKATKAMGREMEAFMQREQAAEHVEAARFLKQ